MCQRLHHNRMEIPEQYPPNKPNFKLIVILFAACIVIFLAIGIWVAHSKHLRDLPDGKNAVLALPVPAPTSA